MPSRRSGRPVSSQPKKRLLPEPIATVVDRSVAAFRSISRAARILLVSTVLAAAALASYFGYQQTHEPYAVLFSQLEQDDAASIVAKLKELNAPYRLGGGGASLEVPAGRGRRGLRELRQDAAGRDGVRAARPLSSRARGGDCPDDRDARHRAVGAHSPRTA